MIEQVASRRLGDNREQNTQETVQLIGLDFCLKATYVWFLF